MAAGEGEVVTSHRNQLIEKALQIDRKPDVSGQTRMSDLLEKLEAWPRWWPRLLRRLQLLAKTEDYVGFRISSLRDSIGNPTYSAFRRKGLSKKPYRLVGSLTSPVRQEEVVPKAL